MFHSDHARRRSRLAGGIALALALLLPALAHGQDVLRDRLVTPGNAQAISISADAIATWAEGGQRAFLLQGRVTVTQGSLVARMPAGVIWVDEGQKEQTGVYALDLYGEETVTLDHDADSRSARQALIQLATRGEIRIKAYGSRVAQQEMSGDPLYRRGRAFRAPPADATRVVHAAPPSPLTPAVMGEAARLGTVASPAREPNPTIQLVQNVVPAPPAPPPPPSTTPPPPATAAPPAGVLPVPRAAGDGPVRLSIRPRSSADFDPRSFSVNGETALVITGGVILTVSSGGPDKKGLLDIEADRMIVWTKGSPQDLAGKSKVRDVSDRAVEFYLSGNVELRYEDELNKSKILRADEVYYNVGNSSAIAVRADLEIRDPKLPQPLHLKSNELHQLNAKTFQAETAEVYSTVLPSDPGLKIQLRQAVIEERELVRRNIFGLPYRDPVTFQPRVEKEHFFTGQNMVTRLEGVPIFYFPYLAGRVEDPLGPLEALSFSYNRVYGFQAYTTWDVFDLLGFYRPKGQRWVLFADYLSARGPALGTQYDYSSLEFFGMPAKVNGLVKAWGIQDEGQDIIGGSRGEWAFLTPTDYVPVVHPRERGRFLGRLNVQELPHGFSFQTQVAAISDRNFLEQFYLNEFFNDYDQDTFAYLKQQQGNWAWTLLGEARLRDWVTETEWLPRADGWLLGQSLADIFTYNAHASAGYARLLPTEEPPFAFAPTDVRVDTTRVDLWQDLSLPFYAGPFKVVPYVVGDLTYYSNDVHGDSTGRAYGGGGVRASLPLSRHYPTVQSELFNLNGIFHKVTLTGNYFNAVSSTPYTDLPQLDRLNDDVSDLTLRQMYIFQKFLNKGDYLYLTRSPLFDPQRYAIRRLVWNRVDTLDDIEVFQAELYQRWQTKRGFPGSQHVVDWMTLSLRASLFPDADRDNFGNAVGILEYDWVWNLGDRTALVSSGWFEPIDHGPRAFDFGAVLNRPDATSFYLGYRQIDPVDSRAVIASLTYVFSPKYAMTATTAWDFGIDNQNYSLILTRLGTDLQVSFGVNYNSILNNFGVTFQVFPNLLRGPLPAGPGTPLNSAAMATATGTGR